MPRAKKLVEKLLSEEEEYFNVYHLSPAQLNRLYQVGYSGPSGIVAARFLDEKGGTYAYQTVVNDTQEGSAYIAKFFVSKTKDGYDGDFAGSTDAEGTLEEMMALFNAKKSRDKEHQDWHDDHQAKLDSGFYRPRR